MDINDSFFSFKELENTVLKATYKMEINGRTIEPGEVITAFEQLDFSGFQQYKTLVTAHGGFEDRNRIYWESTKEIKLSFSQGVMSQTQFGLLTNSRLISYQQTDQFLISNVEEVESNEDGQATLQYEPVDQIFVYNQESGEKIQYTLNGKILTISTPYTSLIVTYRFNYGGTATKAIIGQSLLNGFLELEGRTRIKDDKSGVITTGIIRIPKLKLVSGLSMQLGAQSSPVVANFQAVCVPTGSRGNAHVAEWAFLENNIDSDL